MDTSHNLIQHPRTHLKTSQKNTKQPTPLPSNYFNFLWIALVALFAYFRKAYNNYLKQLFDKKTNMIDLQELMT